MSIRTREIALTALLKDMPIAVIATDLELKVHYVNPACEQLLGTPALKLQQTTLTKHLVDPPTALLNNDLTLPAGMGPKVFYQRLLENKIKNITVWLRTANDKLVPANVILKLGQHHVFQFIPLTEPLTDTSSSTPTTTATATATTKKLTPLQASKN